MMFLKFFITSLFLGFVGCVGPREHAVRLLSSGFGVRSAVVHPTGASLRPFGVPAVVAVPVVLAAVVVYLADPDLVVAAGLFVGRSCLVLVGFVSVGLAVAAGFGRPRHHHRGFPPSSWHTQGCTLHPYL